MSLEFVNPLDRWWSNGWIQHNEWSALKTRDFDNIAIICKKVSLFKAFVVKCLQKCVCTLHLLEREVGHVTRSTIGKIRGTYDQLSRTEKKVAQMALNTPAVVSEMTIKELASATGVSTATISRFVKRMDYANYREFTMALAHLAIWRWWRAPKFFPRASWGWFIGNHCQ